MAAAGINTDAATNDITEMTGFFRENPYFLLPWVALAAVQGVLFNFVPPVVEYCQKHDMQMLGLLPSLKLALFGIVSQFAVHGFVTCYATSLDRLGLKIQTSKDYLFQTERCAMRSSLIILVTMTGYALTPMASATASLLEIFVGYSILCIVHDAWFYCVHRAAHTKQLYALIHKTHHYWKQPMSFSAYYIRSPSQILQEHACIIPCMLLLPVPLTSFLLYQYLGAPLSMVEHSGYRLGDLPLPLAGSLDLPLVGKPSWGHVMTILGGGWSLLLGGQTIDMHDEHHMNFHGNYGLSYSYLDHLLGTYMEPTCKAEKEATEKLLAA
eukprot:TRINITY_DN1188_c0_g2_i2.p1 TRINITY_DN1188_c0_g2~~TRINITY_DN1188_c0_g2_i2.p1  ORF type:complete len:325 (-),score=79.15 TRINITY_DN1188_c0_g2_i2:321-1295(-)